MVQASGGVSVNIVDPILFHCRHQPEAPALSVPGFPVLSYAQLEAMMNNVARAAKARGLREGNTVALLIDDTRLHCLLILALARLGIVTLSIRDPNAVPPLPIDALLSDMVVHEQRMGRFLLADFTWCMGDGKAVEGCESAPDPEALCRIVLTSGTTGEPKAIGYSTRLVRERMLRYLAIFGNKFPCYSRIYCSLGVGTSLGYMLLIYVLYRGGTLLFGNASREAIDAMTLFNVEAWVGSPTDLQSLLTACGETKVESKLEMVLSAGSALSPVLGERAREKLSPNIISVYGSTESTIVATSRVEHIAGRPGAVGYVTSDVRVEAVDEQGRPVRRGEEGLIRVRGPYNVEGYLGDSAASAKAFRDGWFYPGDIGCIAEDGLLVISGRQKNVINVGGDKIRPEVIEDAIVAFGGFEEVGVFAVPNHFGIEEVWAAVVSRSEIDEAELRAHCARRLLPMFVPARVIRIDELPRNEMGKLDRQRMLQFAGPASAPTLSEAVV